MSAASRFACVVGAMLFGAHAYAASPIVFQGDGTPLGVWIQGQGGENHLLLSRTGYCFAVSPRIGTFEVANDCFYLPQQVTQPLRYESSDCSGTPYAEMDEFRRGGWLGLGPGFSALHYVPRGAVPTMRNLASVGTPGSCTVQAVTQRVMPFPRNDPSVTGVPDTLILPLEVRVVEECVFSDGFECPIPPPAK